MKIYDLFEKTNWKVIPGKRSPTNSVLSLLSVPILLIRG